MYFLIIGKGKIFCQTFNFKAVPLTTLVQSDCTKLSVSSHFQEGVLITDILVQVTLLSIRGAKFTFHSLGSCGSQCDILEEMQTREAHCISLP